MLVSDLLSLYRRTIKRRAPVKGKYLSDH